jgi:hypothetical protein
MFTFAKIHFQVECSHPPKDRFVLFSLRRHFPLAFQKAAQKRRDTHAYSHVFDQNLTSDPSALKRFQKPPLPFAFQLPVIANASADCANVDIGISIAGTSVNYLACFVDALNIALKSIEEESKLRLQIACVTSEGYDGTQTTLNDNGDGLVILECDQLLTSTLENKDKIRVTVLTPLRLLHERSVLKNITFPYLVRPLMRRLSSLAYYYGGEEFSLDFNLLSRESEKIISDNSKVSWSVWSGYASGLIGDLTLKGSLHDYLPFLLMGEHFNIGKGATYGMGRLSLTCVDN